MSLLNEKPKEKSFGFLCLAVVGRADPAGRFLPVARAAAHQVARPVKNGINHAASPFERGAPSSGQARAMSGWAGLWLS